MGSAAYLTGQAVARAWKPAWRLAPFALLLGFVDRFLDWGLFGAPPWHVVGFLVDTAILLAIALIAHRLTHVAMVVRQYPWLYARTGPFSYRPIPGSGDSAA
jgi:hypothetical protein